MNYPYRNLTSEEIAKIKEQYDGLAGDELAEALKEHTAKFADQTAELERELERMRQAIEAKFNTKEIAKKVTEQTKSHNSLVRDYLHEEKQKRETAKQHRQFRKQHLKK